MALRSVNLRPGVNSQLTQTANKDRWWASNLIRWRDGLLEKFGGWQRLVDTPAAGLIREMHAYQTLALDKNLLLGTDGGGQLYSNGVIRTFQFARSLGIVTPMTATAGSNLSTVTAAQPHNAVVGDQVQLQQTIYIGGRTIPINTRLTIVSIVDTYNYVVELPQASLTNAAARAMALNSTMYGGVPGTYNLIINVPNHGFSPGQTFNVEWGLNSAVDEYRVTLIPGQYRIVAVQNANYFSIPVSITTNGGAFALYAPLYTDVTRQYLLVAYTTASGPSTVVNWYLDNFGEVGLISTTNGKIFTYLPSDTDNSPLATLMEGAPGASTGMFVAMPQAQVIAFGASLSANSTVQDPMLVRWSDASDYTVWTPSVTNQAGSYRLSQGSRIVGGIQAPQTTLLWTDVGLWSMQYSGPPFVYNLYEIGRGCGLIAPKAQAILNQAVYWMGNRQFYVFDGQSMRGLDCDVWDFVFLDLDEAHVGKIVAGANSSNNEVMFFFPSKSGGTGEIDSYVKLTVDRGGIIWDQGRLGRTSWLDQSVFGQSLAGDLNARIQQHDTGYDADGEPMSGAFAESGYFSLDDGDTNTLVNDIEPDMKWFGGPGAVTITLKGTMHPQGPYFTKGPFGVDQSNQHISPRMRARQLALRIDWVPRLGFSSRLGNWRVNGRPAGKRR